MRKRQAAELLQTSAGHWVVNPAKLEDAIAGVDSLILPKITPARILLVLPKIPPAYFCISSFEAWQNRFLTQVAQYAAHLEALYDFKVPVIIIENRDTGFSGILSWFQRLLVGNFQRSNVLKKYSRTSCKNACGV